MKHLGAVLFCFLAVAFLPISGCKKEDAGTTADQFVDRLTLGTGISGFNIVGETTTFTRIAGGTSIFWRLESVTDMAGSSVKIVVLRQIGQAFTPSDSATYPATESYGHIMLSSYYCTGVAGNYRASGVLVATGRTVASKDFVIL